MSQVGTPSVNRGVSGSRVVAQPLVRRVLAAVLVVASVVAIPSLAVPEQASAHAATDALVLAQPTSAPQQVSCVRVVRGKRQVQRFARKCPRGWVRRTTSPATTTTLSPTTTVRTPVTTAAPTTTTAAPTTTTVRTPTTTTAAPTTTTLPPSASFDARGWEAEILRLTNVERQANGLGTLSACPRLATAALAHTNRMLEGQFFAHNDPGTGSAVVDRIRATGYLDGAGAWRVAENIAMGYESAAATMTGWMNSPGHRANILTPDLTHLGVGVSIGIWDAWRGTYSNWKSATMATQNFGTGGSG